MRILFQKGNRFNPVLANAPRIFRVAVMVAVKSGLGIQKTAPRGGFRIWNLEATDGIEPSIEVLQTSALTTWPRRRLHDGAVSGRRSRIVCYWCRGGDLNSYAPKGTAPSRPRVCRFHHLGPK